MTDTLVKGTAALAKGFMVLQTIAASETPKSAAQIAEANNLSMPMLHCILSCLSANGFGYRIFDFRSRPVAAISVTAPMFRIPMEQLFNFAPVEMEAAARISKKISGKVPATNR